MVGLGKVGESWVGFGMGGGCQQMASEFIHEEMSILFHSEKFYVVQVVIQLAQVVIQKLNL